MYFSKYYNSDYFKADKMHTRAAVAMVDKDYQPPPDIQLFYLLEIINDFSALGQTYLQLNSQLINGDVFTKLSDLGYSIIINSGENIATIRWTY